ncbi:MAG: ATP-dependent zinc metalloprotease FtsH [Bacillota bacterium]
MPAILRNGVLAALAGLIWLLLAAPAMAESRPVAYSEFLSHVQQGRVAAVAISGQSLRATYQDGSVGLVTLPPGSRNLPALLIQYGAKVEFLPAPAAGAGSLLLRLLPPALIIGVILWLSRQGAGRGSGLLSVEQSPARLYRPGSDRVTMRDVAGMDEVKEELQEVVDFLRDASRYRALGARIPKGILLSGPPGTGKTLLARAVAGEAGVPFLSISGSDFVEMYAGVGAARVRSLFEKARQNAPCIVFVDEIDAVARQRGAGLGGGAEERDQTINQLLVEMDGFTPTEGIIVMAATNRIDILDGAVLRPGRFDRQILVDPPDRQGRREILSVHARNKPLGPDVSLDRVASLTTGFTGADLANLLNEAALLAARQQKRQIGMAELTQAFERVVTGGPARHRLMSEEGRRRIAYHEAGHALVGRWLEGPDHVVKMTITPRGRALGYVMYQPGEDRHLHTRQEMLNRLAGLLAGRAAEEIALGEGSTGAADDLERATAMARAMVTQWGMHPAVGPVRTQEASAEQTQRQVDAAVRALVSEAHRRAHELLGGNREALERVAAALMERESMEGAELEELLSGEPAVEPVASEPLRERPERPLAPPGHTGDAIPLIGD